jgi:hypothetical protein
MCSACAHGAAETVCLRHSHHVTSAAVLHRPGRRRAGEVGGSQCGELAPDRKASPLAVARRDAVCRPRTGGCIRAIPEDPVRESILASPLRAWGAIFRLALRSHSASRLGSDGLQASRNCPVERRFPPSGPEGLQPAASGGIMVAEGRCGPYSRLTIAGAHPLNNRGPTRLKAH